MADEKVVTADEIIRAVEGAQGWGDQPVCNADKVVIAKHMAGRSSMTEAERSRLNDWCERQMDAITVSVKLTERERVRLLDRMRTTFDGDVGVLLGFDDRDDAVLKKLGIDVHRPLDASALQSTHESAVRLHLSAMRHAHSSPELFGMKEDAAKRAVIRAALARMVRWIDNFLSRHGYGRDPYVRRVSLVLQEIAARLKSPEVTSVDVPMEYLRSVGAFISFQEREPPMSLAERERRESVRRVLVELIRGITLDSTVPDYRYGESLRHAHTGIIRAFDAWRSDRPDAEHQAVIRERAIAAWRTLAPYEAEKRLSSQRPLRLRRILERVSLYVCQEPACCECGNESGTCPHKLLEG